MSWFGSPKPKKYADFEAEINAQLQRERPADAPALSRIFREPTAFSGVFAVYWPFAIWMYRFDDLKKLPLTVNINSYLFQRKLHVQQVKDTLAVIAANDTGQALFDEIDRIG